MNKKNEMPRLVEVQLEFSCVMCGKATATTSWVQHTFKYGAGKSAVELTAKVPVRSCAHCEFEWLDEVGERLQHEAVCRHFGVLPPEDIRQIRKGHGMTRARFAEVTGLGEASLNRWENGINIQTHANDRYLRLLAIPHTMEELERLVVGGVSSVTDAEPTANPFPHLVELDAVRQQQQAFCLRKAA